MRMTGILLIVAFTSAGCTVGKVISADEMAKQQTSRTPLAFDTPKPAPWNGSWAVPGEEGELISPGKAKIKDTQIVISIITTGWSSFDTPKGESRLGWVDLQCIKDGDVKRVRIEEGDYGFAHGYRIDVSYAYEIWNEERSIYDPHIKYTVQQQ